MQVVGRLAEKRPATEQALQGLLVRHGAQDSLMHPSDLPYFTKLHPGRVLQRQLLALQKPFSEVSRPAVVGTTIKLCMLGLSPESITLLCCWPGQI